MRDGQATQQHAVFIRAHIQRIANAELRQDKAEIAGQLFADAGDPRQQRRALVLVYQVHEPIAQFHRHQRLVRHIGNIDPVG